ncbi:MAG: phospholipase D-like domain-containing protein [Verrucomicrobiota bacterium]
MELLLNRQIYERVIREVIPGAKRFVWITTADIKDLHVKAGRKFEPFLAVLARLVCEGVEVRLVHSKEPGPRFREDFDRFPELVQSDRFERILCPRMHAKTVIVDGKWAYLGSANLTGAGMGGKSDDRRNFEAGILTEKKEVIEALMEEVDQLFLGNVCPRCQRREVCPDPVA